ncbi:MAG: metal-dependent hydrolase [Caulobacteraceae bacterium]
MDPITHAVVGLSIAVLCGEPISLSNPAIIGCVAGAVIPDGDIIMQLKGDYVYLKNHRGLSHSIPAMFVYSAGLTGLLWLAFGNIMVWKVLLFSLIGCLSHIALDITNSYGAQILWPLSKKRITLDLLLIYDPMIVALCLLVLIPAARHIIPPYIIVLAFFIYLTVRYMMKKWAERIALEHLDSKYKRIYFRIMPSMVGLIKWHFILKTDKEKVVGEVNILPQKFKIIDVMKNIDKKLYDIAINTPIAKFFSQFTPIFHVDCENKEGSLVFNFIDLRYYIAKDFLHHATAELNRDLDVVTSLFHPYSKNRNVEV